jgi:hypothetical protein
MLKVVLFLVSRIERRKEQKEKEAISRIERERV